MAKTGDEANEGTNTNFLTRSKPFQKLVDATFKSMDEDGHGSITKDELYAGVLMIHLKVAKFAGSAACYPPSRQTCDELFTAADKDNSGEIDRGEFVEIIQVCCAQIMSRILIYYLIIIVLVPLVATQIVNGLDDYFEIPNGTPKERAAESAVGFILFSLAVPILWNKVDRISRESLEKKKN